MKPTEAAEALGRLTAWIRDYGDQKQPEFIADLQAVLDAVRQELLPLLDSGEITEEWLREMGFTNADEPDSPKQFTFVNGGIVLQINPGPDHLAMLMGPTATRGQLRLLLAALEGKL